MEDSFLVLKEYLATLPVGLVPVDKRKRLAELFQGCWSMFSGSTGESMADYKVTRMENPEWNPPLLNFKIERHGGTVLGSTRADLQLWTMDLDKKEADCTTGGYRQLSPRDTSLNVKPIADELAKLIMSGAQDKRLQWSKGGRVRVLTSEFLSAMSQRTEDGRRKRFNKAMKELLNPHGWTLSGSWWGKKK